MFSGGKKASKKWAGVEANALTAVPSDVHGFVLTAAVSAQILLLRIIVGPRCRWLTWHPRVPPRCVGGRPMWRNHRIPPRRIRCVWGRPHRTLCQSALSVGPSVSAVCCTIWTATRPRLNARSATTRAAHPPTKYGQTVHVRPNQVWKILSKTAKRSSGLRIAGKRGELVRLCLGTEVAGNTKGAPDERDHCMQSASPLRPTMT